MFEHITASEVAGYGVGALLLCATISAPKIDSLIAASQRSKLEQFNGEDFRRWQKKMHFLLTALKVVYVLSTPCPQIDDNSTMEESRKKSKWENDDYICRGHILNGMSNSLFDTYLEIETSKELWDTLEAKYVSEDASSKKFLVGNFMKYVMIDNRPVMDPYHELLRLFGQFSMHKMAMDESICVSSIIEKLPPSWRDFKNSLKHKKEELSLIELGSHLRIEESLRSQESGKNVVGCGKNIADGSTSINMVEVGETSKKNNNKRKFDSSNNKNKAKFNKKPKGTCWHCGKEGHFKVDCFARKHNNGKGKGPVNGAKDPDPPKHQG